MEQAEIDKMFESSRRIAVVGLSEKPDRASYMVARRLMADYEIIPVNPGLDQWEGLRCYHSLTDIPSDHRPDIVDVFRKSADALEPVKQAVQIGARYIVLQQGIVNDEARRLAESNGIGFLQDVCLAVLYTLSPRPSR